MPTRLHRRFTQLTDTLHRHEAAAALAEPPPPPVPPGVELFRPWPGAPLERRASADEWNAHQHLAAERRRAWRAQNPGQPLPPDLFQAPPFALDPAQCPCRLFPPSEAQCRRGATGPPSRREHKRDARHRRAGARAHQSRSRGSRRLACWQNRRERLRNSAGRPAPGKRIRRGPSEAQLRLGASGPPSRSEHKRDARRRRAGARAHHSRPAPRPQRRPHPPRLPIPN